MTPLRRMWTEDEARVLVAIFFHSSFSVGDDRNEGCRLIAECFDRTPSSIDRQWRNIKSILDGDQTKNIGALLRRSVLEFLDHPQALKTLAFQIIARNAWPLEQFFEGPGGKGAFSDQLDPDVKRNFLTSITKNIPELDYKIFPSGSHGYAAESGFLHSGSTFRLQVTCVLSNPDNDGVVDMCASPTEMQAVIRGEIDRAHVARSRLGRLSMIHERRVRLGSEAFNLSLRVHQIGGKSSD